MIILEWHALLTIAYFLLLSFFDVALCLQFVEAFLFLIVKEQDLKLSDDSQRQGRLQGGALRKRPTHPSAPPCPNPT